MNNQALFRGSPRRLRDMRIVLLAGTVVWLSAGCGSSDGTADGGPCPAGQVLRYESAGCGAEAKPVCGSPQQDACYRAVCSCKGVTISRCDYAPEPFAYFGFCPPDGGSPDSLAASDSPAAPDAPPPDSPPALDSPAAPDSPPALDSPAALDLPGTLDSPSALDSPGPTVDGGACPAGQILRYEKADCGAEAKPVCGSPQQDACFRAVCSCKGKTISRCDYAPEPFAAFGACAAEDGGGETASNPCAKCAATEVCVQSFDGTCGLGTIACRTVSEACRNKLSASGHKNCTSLPECESELCSSPFQCAIDSPCPNEAPEVALHCYGP